MSRQYNFLLLVALALVASVIAIDTDGNGIDDECETTSSSSASGDPHFVGFHGQKFDFDGVAFRVFNLITLSSLQMNARFHPNQQFSGQTVIGELGIQTGNSRLSVACTNSTLRVNVDGHIITDSTPVPMGDNGVVTVEERGRQVTVQASPFKFIVNRHKTRNLGCFLDLESAYWGAASDVVVDGVLGRTLYVEKEIASAKNQDDFLVRSDDLFGSDFPVNQFSVAEEMNLIAGKRMLLSRHLLQPGTCGCPDTNALNYDQSTYNDGSCLYLNGTSGTGVIYVNGDCASTDIADILDALAIALGVPHGSITVEQVECTESGSRRRLLAAGEFTVVFSVPESDAGALDAMFQPGNTALEDELVKKSLSKAKEPARVGKSLKSDALITNEQGVKQNPCFGANGPSCGSNSFCIPQGPVEYTCLCAVGCESDPCASNPCQNQPDGLTKCFTRPDSNGQDLAECYGSDIRNYCAPSGCPNNANPNDSPGPGPGQDNANPNDSPGPGPGQDNANPNDSPGPYDGPVKFHGQHIGVTECPVVNPCVGSPFPVCHMMGIAGMQCFNTEHTAMSTPNGAVNIVECGEYNGCNAGEECRMVPFDITYDVPAGPNGRRLLATATMTVPYARCILCSGFPSFTSPGIRTLPDTAISTEFPEATYMADTCTTPSSPPLNNDDHDMCGGTDYDPVTQYVVNTATYSGSVTFSGRFNEINTRTDGFGVIGKIDTRYIRNPSGVAAPESHGQLTTTTGYCETDYFVSHCGMVTLDYVTINDGYHFYSPTGQCIPSFDGGALRECDMDWCKEPGTGTPICVDKYEEDAPTWASNPHPIFPEDDDPYNIYNSYDITVTDAHNGNANVETVLHFSYEVNATIAAHDMQIVRGPARNTSCQDWQVVDCSEINLSYMWWTALIADHAELQTKGDTWFSQACANFYDVSGNTCALATNGGTSATCTNGNAVTVCADPDAVWPGNHETDDPYTAHGSYSNDGVYEKVHITDKFGYTEEVWNLGANLTDTTCPGDIRVASCLWVERTSTAHYTMEQFCNNFYDDDGTCQPSSFYPNKCAPGPGVQCIPTPAPITTSPSSSSSSSGSGGPAPAGPPPSGDGDRWDSSLQSVTNMGDHSHITLFNPTGTYSEQDVVLAVGAGDAITGLSAGPCPDDLRITTCSEVVIEDNVNGRSASEICNHFYTNSGLCVENTSGSSELCMEGPGTYCVPA